MTHAFRLVLLVSLAFALPSRAWAGAPCPPSAVQLFTSLGIPPDHVIVSAYTAAAFETTAAGRMAGYDLIGGTVRMAHPGTLSPLFVQAVDRYRVVGVPDGTPIALVALYDVDGWVQSPGCGGTGCHGYFGAQIAHEATAVKRVVDAGFNGRASLVETLQLPLDVTAGQEVELRFSLWFYRSSAGYYGEGTGRLRFAGLPAGATVVSCQGYGSATPTQVSTWGRVKAAYR